MAASFLRQDPSAADAPQGGAWDALLDVVRAPYVVELLLLLGVVGIGFFVVRRIVALVRHAGDRAALADYLLGVEQALQGDLSGAEKRLRAVVAQDPDNHFGRLMLGKVLGDLGHAEQAHQQHVYLRDAFQVESGENELLLAQSLLAAGLPAEAADVGERAMARSPSQAAGWEFVYRARLRQGDHEGASAAGKKLLACVRDPAERARLQRDVARTFAEAGVLAWRSGDGKHARHLAKEAAVLDEGQGALPLLRARLDAAAGDRAVLAKQLSIVPEEETPRDAGAMVPAGATANELAAVDGPGALPIATFSGLLEPARWICRSCSQPLERQVHACLRCGEADPCELVEPSLVASVESPTEAMDRIDVNDAHVKRLIQRLARGDAAARAELVPLGDAAVPELLRAAWRSSGAGAELAISALEELGPVVAPVLFEAGDQLARARLLPLDDGPATVIGRVVQSYGRDALPHMEPLFRSTRSDHRRILIDYFLGLADVDAFQRVLERVPPMEILRHLNEARPEVLRSFLACVPRGHFLSESLLLEPTFYRDDALLAACAEAEDRDALVAVMLGREPTRTLITSLVAGLRDEVLAPTAARVLEAIGEPALEHALAAFASEDADEAVHERLARVVVRGGAAAAAHIAESFGPEPSAVDDRLRRLLVIIGDVGVDALLAAFDRSGWLEKVAVGLLSRHNNRRVQLARALGELGTSTARDALHVLIEREKDDNLRLTLERALHGAGGSRG